MSLLSRLFRRQPVSDVPTETLPNPDQVVQVIGDVHGCHSLLLKLLDRLPAADKQIFLGDYVDRGEDSKAVISCLFERQTTAPDSVVCLMGNHEKMMLDFLDTPEERGERWLRNGGLQTLASYGVRGVNERMQGDELLATCAELGAAMPDGHHAWLQGLPKSWTSGNLAAVHAAADPGRAIADQDDKVLLWGHPAFLRKPRRDGIWVAHGHTVLDTAEFQNNRIGVDTGAYFSDCLTAATIYPDGRVEFTST